jgi:hypothetical protein
MVIFVKMKCLRRLYRFTDVLLCFKIKDHRCERHSFSESSYRLALKVINYFKRDTENNGAKHGVSKSQERTSEHERCRVYNSPFEEKYLAIP